MIVHPSRLYDTFRVRYEYVVSYYSIVTLLVLYSVDSSMFYPLQHLYICDPALMSVVLNLRSFNVFVVICNTDTVLQVKLRAPN